MIENTLLASALGAFSAIVAGVLTQLGLAHQAKRTHAAQLAIKQIDAANAREALRLQKAEEFLGLVLQAQQSCLALIDSNDRSSTSPEVQAVPPAIYARKAYVIAILYLDDMYKHAGELILACANFEASLKRTDDHGMLLVHDAANSLSQAVGKIEKLALAMSMNSR